MRCENCGCGLHNGICSNCHEESYILTYQSDGIDFPLSDEFIEKANSQDGEIALNRRKLKNHERNKT